MGRYTWVREYAAFRTNAIWSWSAVYPGNPGSIKRSMFSSATWSYATLDPRSFFISFDFIFSLPFACAFLWLLCVCVCHISVSAWFCFDIMSSCFVCQRSGGFPVFCLTWVSSVCLHVIWARVSRSFIITSFTVSRCCLICIVIISTLLCKP